MQQGDGQIQPINMNEFNQYVQATEQLIIRGDNGFNRQYNNQGFQTFSNNYLNSRRTQSLRNTPTLSSLSSQFPSSVSTSPYDQNFLTDQREDSGAGVVGQGGKLRKTKKGKKAKKGKKVKKAKKTKKH